MTAGHGRHGPDWAHYRTVEGGFLFDRQALYEAHLVAGGADPALADLPDRAASARAAAPRGKSVNRAEIERVLVPLLDAGVASCPHGRPLGVDLALSEPTAVEPDLRVAPAWAEPAPTEEGALRLLAGPAMGSGRWPWTRAALRALRRLVRAGDRVADVGTGTGILGLYALRRGAGCVDGVDIDPIAAAVARWNARANGLAERMSVRVGSSEALDDGYNLAVVSVLAVWEVAPVVEGTIARLRSGGLLVASPAHGAGECDQLETALREMGLTALEAFEAEDWFVWAARRP
ncbi:MAG TPA: 50S ribosomal protein L11 methyltransferase [Chloroflexota bacterium]|jgi:precorrin-6B methylase 2